MFAFEAQIKLIDEKDFLIAETNQDSENNHIYHEPAEDDLASSRVSAVVRPE